MTKAIELAHWVEVGGWAKVSNHGRDQLKKIAAELRRLASAEQELADLKAAMGEPVARVNDDGLIVETGLDIAPGVFLYAKAKP